jgi:hypothetical protein
MNAPTLGCPICATTVEYQEYRPDDSLFPYTLRPCGHEFRAITGRRFGPDGSLQNVAFDGRWCWQHVGWTRA